MSEVTKLQNLINPEVLSDMIEKKLTDYIRFAPLADVDSTLVGRPGDTLSMPSYQYIGDASILAEGSELSCVSLNASMVSATVHKIAQGVTLTDEAVLSGYGDPVGEAEKQIAHSIANGVDKEMLNVLKSIASPMVYETSTSTTALVANDIGEALTLFGEDIDGTKVLLCSPKLYAKIRKTTDWLPAAQITAEKIIEGAVGEIAGCQVIVSNKLADKTHEYDEVAFIVKPGALRVILKRDTMVEPEREAKKFQTSIVASKHFVCYLYDASKAIKLGKKA